MAHGSGGRDSALLMAEIFGPFFANPVLDRLEDAAVLPSCDILPINPANADSSLVISTDSFVVTPLEFKGGDIGKLAVCGTVNDLLMMGAAPRYLTCGFILEEGLPIEQLSRIVASMAETARSAGVAIIAGDTKVVEGGGGLYINTTGIGLRTGQANRISAGAAQPGDAVLLSGNLGDHHACILSARMGIENGIKSDCALLADIVSALLDNGVEVRVMRDVTRGGLGTVLNEVAAASRISIEVEETAIPVHPEVRGFCGIMGLDPLYMGNEGKMIVIVRGSDAEQALALMRATEIGQNACRIGHVVSGNAPSASQASPASVVMRTRIGGRRRIDMLYGEGLPRIC